MKTFFVQSEMVETGDFVEKQIGTGEFKKGLFGKKEIMTTEKVWVKSGNSDCFIDGQVTAKKLAEKLAEIEKLGMVVHSVESVISGNWKYETGSLMNQHGLIIKNKTNAGGWGYGYGYSYTSGYIIFAK